MGLECLPSAKERNFDNYCKCPEGYQDSPLAPQNSECVGKLIGYNFINIKKFKKSTLCIF